MLLDRAIKVLCAALIAGFIGCSEETGPSASTQSDTPAKTVSEAVTEETTDYPIDYCVVSGEKLGSMGDAIEVEVEVEVEGRTVMLCCQMCKSKLLDDPEGYLAILDAAATGESQAPEADSSHGSHQH